MAPRPATISAADLARLIRAAKKEGARAVKLSLTTGEVAEFVLVDNGEGGEKHPARLVKKPRAII